MSSTIRATARSGHVIVQLLSAIKQLSAPSGMLCLLHCHSVPSVVFLSFFQTSALLKSLQYTPSISSMVFLLIFYIWSLLINFFGDSVVSLSWRLVQRDSAERTFTDNELLGTDGRPQPSTAEACLSSFAVYKFLDLFNMYSTVKHYFVSKR